MTPRRAIGFFRKPVGAFLLFLLLLIAAYLFFIGLKPPTFDRPKRDAPSADDSRDSKPQVLERITRKMSEFHPPQPLSATPTPTPPLKKAKEEPKPLELPPISLYASTAVSEEPEPLGTHYAPFGRLIRCELVVTVDSSSISTPIIGLVTDDVWHAGRLIIPAGTEVHGSATVDRVRERIASAGGWTLVWQSGEELTLSGIALDREKSQDDEGWAITDGSAGLRGQLVKSDDLAEIKLFAATFLSGAADALTDKQQTLLGTQALPTLENAPFEGAQQVLNVYAQQILSTIQRDGFYVRVPAGKQFYLYVTQTIDKERATIGGTRLAQASDGASATAIPESDAELRRQLIRRAINTPAVAPLPPSKPTAPLPK